MAKCIVIGWDWDGPGEGTFRQFCEAQPKLFNGRTAPALTFLSSPGSALLVGSSEPLTEDQAEAARELVASKGGAIEEIVEIEV